MTVREFNRVCADKETIVYVLLDCDGVIVILTPLTVLSSSIELLNAVAYLDSSQSATICVIAPGALMIIWEFAKKLGWI